MSYSMEEPEWPPMCECVYDEERDEIDRGNCQLHCNQEEARLDDPQRQAFPEAQALRKPATAEPGSVEPHLGIMKRQA
jgi:hypothetical protein